MAILLLSLSWYLNYTLVIVALASQQTITCSKSTIETEKGVKYVQS